MCHSSFQFVFRSALALIILLSLAATVHAEKPKTGRNQAPAVPATTHAPVPDETTPQNQLSLSAMGKFMQNPVFAGAFQAAQWKLLRTSVDLQMMQSLLENPALRELVETLENSAEDEMKSTVREGLLNFTLITPERDAELDKIVVKTARLIGFTEDEINDRKIFKKEGDINAYTSSSKRLSLVLQSDLLRDFTQPEDMAVLGHEMSHIRFKHVYQDIMMMVLITQLGEKFTGKGMVDSEIVARPERAKDQVLRAALKKLRSALNLERSNSPAFNQKISDSFFRNYEAVSEKMKQMQKENPSAINAVLADFLNDLSDCLDRMEMPQETRDYVKQLRVALQVAEDSETRTTPQYDPEQFVHYMTQIIKGIKREQETSADLGASLAVPVTRGIAPALKFSGEKGVEATAAKPRPTRGEIHGVLQQLIQAIASNDPQKIAEATTATTDKIVEATGLNARPTRIGLHAAVEQLVKYNEGQLAEFYRNTPQDERLKELAEDGGSHPVSRARVQNVWDNARKTDTIAMRNPFLRIVVTYEELVHQAEALSQRYEREKSTASEQIEAVLKHLESNGKVLDDDQKKELQAKIDGELEDMKATAEEHAKVAEHVGDEIVRMTNLLGFDIRKNPRLRNLLEYYLARKQEKMATLGDLLKFEKEADDDTQKAKLGAIKERLVNELQGTSKNPLLASIAESIAAEKTRVAGDKNARAILANTEDVLKTTASSVDGAEVQAARKIIVASEKPRGARYSRIEDNAVNSDRRASVDDRFTSYETIQKERETVVELVTKGFKPEAPTAKVVPSSICETPMMSIVKLRGSRGK